MAGIDAGEGAAAAPPPEQRVEQVRRVPVCLVCRHATPLLLCDPLLLGGSAPRRGGCPPGAGAQLVCGLVIGGNITFVFLVLEYSGWNCLRRAIWDFSGVTVALASCVSLCWCDN